MTPTAVDQAKAPPTVMPDAVENALALGASGDAALALQAQIADLREVIAGLEGRIARLVSPDNLPEQRLLQAERAVLLLAAIVGEAKAEHFKSDVSGLMPEIAGKVAPLRARVDAAEEVRS